MRPDLEIPEFLIRRDTGKAPKPEIEPEAPAGDDGKVWIVWQGRRRAEVVQLGWKWVRFRINGRKTCIKVPRTTWDRIVVEA